uniref:Calmodulin n=1 Tax=Zooxanthella nutricula TaxID=1333877 RepID=A0A7S2KP93_9DINO
MTQFGASTLLEPRIGPVSPIGRSDMSSVMAGGDAEAKKAKNTMLSDSLGLRKKKRSPREAKGPARMSARGREMLMPVPAGIVFATDKEAKQAAKPEDPETWPERLRTAALQVCHKLSTTQFVTLTRLEDMLKLAGHSTVWSEVVGKIVSRLPSLAGGWLSASATFSFVCEYEEKIMSDVQREFKLAAGESETISFTTLEDLVDRLGYTPLPHSLIAILQEAADIAAEPWLGRDAISLSTFEAFVQLLTERDGFSQAEVAGLDRAFTRFDRDDSGTIDPEELQPILCWLGCCAHENVTAQLEEVMRAEGSMDRARFRTLLRQHRALQYAHTHALFERYCSPELTVAPADLVRMFKKLRLSLLPETLWEVVEECELPHDAFGFTDFWSVLQGLRQREGFHSRELKEIGDTFRRFDRYGKGELFTRSLPNALRWMGHLLGQHSTARVDWKPEYGGRARITQAEFLKVVRDHTEADILSLREAFRQVAPEGGACPLPMSKLKATLEKLNKAYTQDCDDVIRKTMVQKWLRKANATFDFEEFRHVVARCRERARDRLRANQGFTDAEVTRLRKLFSQKLADCDNTAKETLPPAALIELFKIVTPMVEKSPEARNMLKKAINIHEDDHGSLDLPAFLKVMRTFEDLIEEEQSVGTPMVKQELGIPVVQVDDFLDIFSDYIRNGPQSLTAQDMRMLYSLGKGAPSRVSTALNKVRKSVNSTRVANAAVNAMQFNPLTYDQASRLKEHFLRMQDQKGAAGTVQQFIAFTKALRDVTPEQLDHAVA